MSRRIGFLALPGFQLLDVSGPLDVFAQANRIAGRYEYELSVVGVAKAPIRSSSGVRLLPDETVAGSPVSPFEVLLVAGGPDLPERPIDSRTLHWLMTQAMRANRYGSVCTGAFALGEAGLLDQPSRLTTHWAYAQQLAARYPSVTVEADAIYVRDRALRTSAGVTAGMDLALALVEEDLGQDLAKAVASDLVLYFRRQGGQLQFSRPIASPVEIRSALQELQRWVSANLDKRHTVDSLAKQAGLSPRTFARVFALEIGLPPSAWLERVRIDRAKQLLEEGGLPKQVADKVAFTSVDTFRLAFMRQAGVSPASYRKSHAHKR